VLALDCDPLALEIFDHATVLPVARRRLHRVMGMAISQSARRERDVTIRVYQFGLRPPHDGIELVREQMRASHRYSNDLVAIERGRRWAMRTLIHERDPAVTEAAEMLRAATRSTRTAARKALTDARRAAEKSIRCDGGHWAVPLEEVDRYRYSPLYESERITLLEQSIRRDARAICGCYWGTYQTLEESADRGKRPERMAPVDSVYYAQDGISPRDRRFSRWPTGEAWPREAQIGVHIQNKVLKTSDAKAGSDSQVRWIHQPGGEHELWLRVGSDGTSPRWAKWHQAFGRGAPSHLDREVPDGATWKWVRVSVRHQGPLAVWSCEITADVDLGAREKARELTSSAIAVELLWSELDDGGMLVAKTLDSEGEQDSIVLLAYTVEGLTKPASIRSVRDVHRNYLVPKLARLLRETKDDLPPWLREAANTLHLWKSPSRFHGLAKRWRTDKCDAAREAYDLLQEWELRDQHLWEYEAGARAKALGRRKDQYRVVAARLSAQYRYVLLPDRDLSREARWSEESDRRFLASPQELRDCLRAAFGAQALDVPWRGAHGVLDDGDEESDVSSWLEWAIEQWRDGKITESARKRQKTSDSADVAGGAWARRKAARQARYARDAAAREAAGKDAE
jgi:hypothetical protein